MSSSYTIDGNANITSILDQGFKLFIQRSGSTGTKVDRQTLLGGGNAIVHGQIKVVLLDGHLTGSHQFILRNLRASNDLFSQTNTVIDDVIVHILILDTGTQERTHTFALVDLDLDQTLLDVMGVNREADSLLRFSIERMELRHQRNLIFSRHGLPISNQIVSLDIAKQRVNRIVRAIHYERNIKPVLFRNQTHDVVFKTSHIFLLLSSD